MGATLATSENSGFVKEYAKYLAKSGLTYNPARDIKDLIIGQTYKDKFFQLNSTTGDILTSMNEKDNRTNIDAYILHYHPMYKNLPLNKSIEDYYNTENLANKREILYNNLLESKARGNSAQDQKALMFMTSALTLAGVYLVYTRREEIYKEIKKDPILFAKETFIKAPIEITKFTLRYTKNAIVYYSKKVINTVTTVLDKTKNKVGNFTKNIITKTKVSIENINNKSKNIKSDKVYNPKSITKNLSNKVNNQKATTNTKNNISKQTNNKNININKQIESPKEKNKQSSVKNSANTSKRERATKSKNTTTNNKSNTSGTDSIKVKKESVSKPSKSNTNSRSTIKDKIIKPVVEKIKKAVRRK